MSKNNLNQSDKLGKYNTNIELKWSKKWNDSGLYKWNPEVSRENTFVVDTPPPTVSGNLHIGHIFSYTHTDFIVRFQRMMGKNIFYPIGFDDNGLPTERLVEKKKKVKASNMPRAEFIELCKNVIEEEEEKFRDLFKSIGYSFDWSLEYQTISSHTQKISQMSFIDLVNKGEIYRKNQPMLWDTVDQTALAQTEIEEKEFESYMNDIEFTTHDNEKIVIATTRPELLPACVAIFYHPHDSRYQHLVGKHAVTPLFDLTVPIYADEEVKMDKGTGLVMCCTFGDTLDILWWKKHHLPLKIIIDRNGRIKNDIEFIIHNTDKERTINSKAQRFFDELKGLKIKDARSKILEMLHESKVLLKQTPITQSVKCAERSGAPLEILSTYQWFIKTIDYKDELLKLSNQLNWFPKTMKIKLDTWINGVSWDWCISRQRFFGVPIPVWYSKRKGEEGKIIYGNINDLPIDPTKDLPTGYTRSEVDPETDVFDTWATSCVTPQINSHAIHSNLFIDQYRHQKLFPADLRPQAHEIIRVWAFGTMLKSYLHQKSLPWHNIMISGWCLAHDKTKMSKSKGNTITPENLITEYGADAVRYWASSARLGSDVAYSPDVMKLGKKLVNKIWNASKFASINFDIIDNKKDYSNKCIVDILNNLIISSTIYYPIDLWIIKKLYLLVNEVELSLSKFEYCVAKEKLESFFWKDYCDNYLEIIKVRSYGEKESENTVKSQKSAVYTLYCTLNIILKLFAPYLPFVTEEIHSIIYTDTKSLHSNSWPKFNQFFLNNLNNVLIDSVSHAVNTSDSPKSNFDLSIDVILDILVVIRKYKADMQQSIKVSISSVYVYVKENIQVDSLLIEDLINVTNIQNIELNNIDRNENLNEDYHVIDTNRVKLYIRKIHNT